MEYPIQMDDYHWLSGYSLTSYNMIHSYNMHYVLKREAHVCYTVSGIPMDNIWESRIDWLLFRGLATARWFPLYLFTVLLPWQGAIASATAKLFPEAGYQTILGRDDASCSKVGIPWPIGLLKDVSTLQACHKKYCFCIQMYTVRLLDMVSCFINSLASLGLRGRFANLPPCCLSSQDDHSKKSLRKKPSRQLTSPTSSDGQGGCNGWNVIEAANQLDGFCMKINSLKQSHQYKAESDWEVPKTCTKMSSRNCGI